MAEAGSTNDVAMARAGEGAAPFLAITAKRMTAGRGRRGRAWEAPEGNLYLSAMIHSARPAVELSGPGLVAGLAVHQALGGLGVETIIKWPNDVLAGDGSMAKLCGILTEMGQPAGSVTPVVIGIGINVASHPDGLDRPVTSLAALGCGAAVEEVRDAVLARLADALAGFEQSGLAACLPGWQKAALPVGTGITVHQGDVRVQGRVAGLRADGALLLETDGGDVKTITTGDAFVT